MIETPAEKTARLASIPAADLDWLIAVSVPGSIQYERRHIAAAESRRGQPDHGPESLRSILATHGRILRRLENDLAELETERDRRTTTPEGKP
jgi:hypothetical protein